MSPSRIISDQALGHFVQAFKASDPPHRNSGGNKPNRASKADSLGEIRVHRDPSAFHRLQAMNERLNRTAMKARATDRIMDTIGKYIEEVKAQMERIIKNFPPFPPGSEERAKILRSYTALRKQIDQMAFSPGGVTGKAALTEEAAVEQIRDQKAMGSGPSTGPPEWVSLPELSGMATDQEIAAAIERLRTDQEILQRNRAKLAAEALGFSRSEIMGKKFQELSHSDQEELKLSDLTEESAEQKSRDLRHTLRAETIKPLTESQFPLVHLSE